MYLAERFSDAMKSGGRALLAGVAAEQLPADLRADPRVICWDSDAPQLDGARRIELPPRTRAVMMARFLSHATATQLQRASKRADAVYFGKVQGTGEIARVLREAFHVEKPLATLPPLSPRRAPVVEDAPASFASASDAVRYFARAALHEVLPPGRKNFSPKSSAFYARLGAQVREHGFGETTDAQVAALFWYARKGARALAAAEAVPEPAPVEASVVEAAAPAPVLVPAVVEPLPADLAALVTMADDLDARALAASDLADKLRGIERELRTLRAVKARYDAMLRAAAADEGVDDGNPH
jgi:hypothetical protein